MNWYGLASYNTNAGERPAVRWDNGFYDLRALAAAIALDGRAPPAPQAGELSLDHLFTHWAASQAWVDYAVGRLPQLIADGRVRAMPDTPRLGVPFTPRRIFGMASNFYEHADEMGTELAARAESQPYCFMKAETSVIAAEESVMMPPETEKLDWEVELGVVIGKTCRHVEVDRAFEYVAGYTVFNDISARDLNRRTDYPFKHDWFRGKSFDTFGPIGPWVVPAACIADPQSLRMTLSVNGKMMQDGSSRDMIFSIAEQIAYLSRILTLQSGDLIATGTPDGVGMGRGVFLKAGDVMIAGIEHIGYLRNPVVAETVPLAESATPARFAAAPA